MKRLYGWILLAVMVPMLLSSGCSLFKKEEPKVELYQLAPEHDSLMQCYVIKTLSGKLIVIDGGIDGVGYNAETYLPFALRAIAGVGEDEYFEVEAWFLSHAHKDHYFELAKMLNVYDSFSNYKINNFYFDFPDFETDEYPGSDGDFKVLRRLKQGLDRYAGANEIEVPEGSSYYDMLNGAVINAEAIEKGLNFEIDGITIQALNTWAKSDGNNINNNSLVLRFLIGDQSVLFLNDLGADGGKRLLANFGDAIKSDICQMAHHGQGGVNADVYEVIDAKVHLWPTPLWVWNNIETYRIGETRTWIYGENFYGKNEFNIVACLYDAYPTNSRSVAAWKKVLNGMKISFPYAPAYAEESVKPEE